MFEHLKAAAATCAVGLLTVGTAMTPAHAGSFAAGHGPPDPATGSTPNIIGGVESPTNAYPWIVSTTRPGFARWCGGTLISPIWVLTAAHCVDEGTTPAELGTLIGQTDTVSGSGGERRAVIEIHVMPGWNPATKENDVALIRLATPSTKTPLQVASSAEADLWAPNRTVRTMGWGATVEGGQTQSRLREVDIPVQPDATMSGPASYGSAFKPASMLGAGPLAGGKDSCQGDSGGPLLANTPRGWRQVGIVSNGEGCARPNKPGIYSRIGDQALNSFIRTTAADSVVDGFAGRSGDFNGDGRTDIVTFTRTGAVFVALSNGSSFVGTGSLWHGAFGQSQEVPLIGDFNGDGKDDIVTFNRIGEVFVALSTGSSFVGTASRWHASFVFGGQVPAVGDFNGDGRDDIAAFNRGPSGDVFVALSNGFSFGSSVLWSTMFAQAFEIPMVGDFNGDGRDDIVAFHRSATSQVFVGLSTGSSFAPTGNRWLFGGAEPAEIPAVGDFTGDGRDDIAIFNRAGRVFVARSTGTAFGILGLWHDDFGYGNEIPGTGDFNGDGRDDISVFTRLAAADVFVALSNGSNRFLGTALKWHDVFAANTEIPMGGSLW